MAVERSNDLRVYESFIDGQRANGEADLTVDEALARWEYGTPPEDGREEILKAVCQGFADIEAGRVRPVEDFDREFRRKHGLLPRA